MAWVAHLLPRRVVAPAAALAACILGSGAAASRAATTTVFAGSTSADHYPLVLKVRGGRIVAVATMFRAPCSSGRHYSFGGDLRLTKKPIPIRKGRFDGSFVVPEKLVGGQTSAITFFLKGTQKGSKLIGTLRAGAGIGSDPAGPADTCVTPSLAFTIVHRTGIVYGGTTSQGLPVVLELARSRTRVQHLHIGWRAACASGAGFQFVDFLHGGALTDGAFGGSFSTDADASGGGSFHSDYGVTGKVSKTAGTGKLKVTVTERDAAGAVQDTCSTSGVTFRVAS